MTTDLATPTAKRLSPPSRRDSRLLVGVLLVLASVVLGALAVGAADNRVGVWAAKHDMTPGDRVAEGDLVRVEVHLGDDAARYLATSSGVPDAAEVDRLVRAGELVPRSALVDAGGLDVREVPVRVDPMYLENLSKGSVVDVYSAPPLTQEERQGGELPQFGVELERVTVHEVPKEQGGVMAGARQQSSVVLLIPDDKVADIIQLDSGESQLRVVARGGSVGGGSE